MIPPAKISAVIITYNEEKNISDCINSVIDIVDEVIVVDAHSTDQTRQSANELGAKVIVNDWISFGIQKNIGAEQAKNNWILSIDADERVDKDLKLSIQKLNLFKSEIYAINVKTNYLGKWIRYCGWYPNYKKRIYNKLLCKWSSDHVHESLEYQEKMKIIKLPGNLLHYSYPSLERHHEKIQSYAKLTAEKWLQQNRSPGLLKKLFGPSFRFFKTYILKLGILDGREGFLISKMSAQLVHEQLNYFKQLESK